MSDDSNTSQLFTVSQFCKKHPAFSAGGLRWQIFNENSNGLAKAQAIIRVGRRVLIHEGRYLRAIGASD